MASALFPGTFDPPTLGHIEIIERASTLFDILFVGVGENSEKQHLFSVEDRIYWLKQATRHIPNISIISFNGLAVDCALENNCACLLRGIRSTQDMDREQAMAHTNKKLRKLETLFLLASPDLSHIRSSLIKEIILRGEKIENFLPKSIEKDIFQKWEQQLKLK